MATLAPLFGGVETRPPESLTLQLGSSKRVLSVDQHGHSQLVTPTRSREDPSEFSPIPLKHLESSTNAPTSSSLGSMEGNVGLMSKGELDELVAKRVSVSPSFPFSLTFPPLRNVIFLESFDILN